MKLIYSHLKTFLPDLDVPAEKLRDDLTLIGHFTNYYETIKSPSFVKEGNPEGEGDFILDLDIKVNRADCLGYYGLARDLSVLYNLPFQTTNYQLQTTDYHLPITITSSDVIRIQALKISSINNTRPSPDWLINFLKLHQINPINLLVDLTNYIMFLYGLPCHAFDTRISTDELVWENNQKYTDFTTLDGTKLQLHPGILMVNNPVTALSLSFLGGQSCAISPNTTDTIIEMAAYNPSRVRTDSRRLKTITEASIRLDKGLDPQSIPSGFRHLAQLILDLCGGQIVSSLFEYYPQKITPLKIDFHPLKPSLYAGINIPKDFALDVLHRLDCQVNKKSPLLFQGRRSAIGGEGINGVGLERFVITPPSIRQDLTLEEDLIEEVIRFYGYNQIPTNQPISNQKLTDITPKILYLIESLKDKLVSLGYDEIRSWPLVSTSTNPAAVISTQNSINSDFPYLRQSIIQSLRLQLDQYQRYKLPYPQFFEVGKIFYKEKAKFIEKYALGIYHPSSEQLSKDLKRLTPCPVKRQSASGGGRVGEGFFAEIILDDLPYPTAYQPSSPPNTAYELTSQIITLDANVTFEENENPTDLIAKYTALISPDILWSITLVDVFINRCTLRVSYYNCHDKTAKSTHLKVFNLSPCR